MGEQESEAGVLVQSPASSPVAVAAVCLGPGLAAFSIRSPVLPMLASLAPFGPGVITPPHNC